MLVVANDTAENFSGEVLFGKKELCGKEVVGRKAMISVPAGGLYKAEVDFDVKGKNTYLYAQCGDYKNLYSPTFWRECDFASDYGVKTDRVSDNEIKVTVVAKTFVKGLFLSFKDNFRYLFSDNYLDMEAGDTVTVTVKSDKAIDEKGLSVAAFDEMTKKSK